MAPKNAPLDAIDDEAADDTGRDELEAGSVKIRINPQFWRTDVIEFGEDVGRLRVDHEGVVVDEAVYEALAEHRQEYVGNDGETHHAQLVVKC